ncbi:hypothetical protein Bbelb_255380 [Branchiostoma belcheri]|nr:hypothetical protein Bbelb_255380 [Branchiostoma belcheri]
MLSARGLRACNSSGVHYLSLVEGGITDIETTSLGVFLDLQLLYLDYNNLSHVKKDWLSTLRRPDALVVLSLSHNRIVDIESESFARLGMLKVLSLEHNRLRNLHPDWFYGLTNLTRLNLFSNRLETLPKTAFVVLTELKQLDMRENELLNLPKGFRWPQKNPMYHLTGTGLLGARDPTFEWRGVVMSDLSLVQISVSGLSTYSTHADKWFRYETRTRDGTRLTSSGFGIGYGKLAFSQSYTMEEQKYPAPFLIIAAMEGEDTASIEKMNYWCERFWAGDDTVSVTLGASKETTVQLAAVVTKKDNDTTTLISVLFNPAWPPDEESSYVNNQTRANHTGTRVVMCVMLSEMNKSESYFVTKRGESKPVHARHNISDQSWNNNTAVNKTNLVRDGEPIENSTTFRSPVDVSLSPRPTEIDVTLTVRPELPDKDEPVLSDGMIFVIIAGIFLDTVVTTFVVRMLVKRRCPSRRHDDGRHDDGRHDYENDYENTDISHPVLHLGLLYPTHGVGQASTSGTAEDDDSSYSEIPDDYFSFNNPGYRYQRNSLPPDDHNYWQILDEFYGYENTDRLANWRPSSLPLTFEATYENAKYENVGRWQRQRSDIDYTPMTGKVGKKAGAIGRPISEDTESLANWRPSSLPLTLEATYENVKYENVGRWSRQPSAAARGRPTTKRQRSRDMIMRGGYGTESRLSTVESGGHNMAARVGWRARLEERDNISYDVAKRFSDRRTSAYQSPRRVRLQDRDNTSYDVAKRFSDRRTSAYQSPRRVSVSMVESGGQNMAARVGWRVRLQNRDNFSYDVAKRFSDRRTSAYQSPRRVSVSRSNNRAYQSHWKSGKVSIHKYWNQEIPFSEETTTGFKRLKPGRRHSL